MADRRLLAGVLALPVVGGLLGILGPGEAAGKGRSKRRVKKHKDGKRRTHTSRAGVAGEHD